MSGKGKCIICGCEDIAHADVSFFITQTTDEDKPYFEDIKANTCKNCGFMQLTSKKVTP